MDDDATRMNARLSWTTRAAGRWNTHAQTENASGAKGPLPAIRPSRILGAIILGILVGGFLFALGISGTPSPSILSHSNSAPGIPTTGLVTGTTLAATGTSALTSTAHAPLALAGPGDRLVVSVPSDYQPALLPLGDGQPVPRLPESYRVSSGTSAGSTPANPAGVIRETGNAHPLAGNDPSPAGGAPSIRYAAGELLVQLAPNAIQGIGPEEVPLTQATYAPAAAGVRTLFHTLDATPTWVTRIRRVKVATNLSPSAQAGFGSYYVLHLDPDTDLIAVSRSFAATRKADPTSYPGIVRVQPNYAYDLTLLPNDSRYSLEWGLQNTGQEGGVPGTDIDAPHAWDATTGSSSVVVGDIDTGVWYTHPDLAANMWHNPGEIPNNGIDDDGDGYIDDYYGWDFYSNDADPVDFEGHGTHTSGTIAAATNNTTGIAGVCWNCKIMALKFFGPSGGFTDGAIAAFAYAAAKGARITSNSWAGGLDDPALHAAIEAADAAGVLVVAAAGNLNGEQPMYPAYYEETVSVASIDLANEPSFFSNHNLHVDVAAPGSQIQSTIYPGSELADYCTHDLDPTHYYTSCSGTSMAAPHVAGIAGLLAARNPNLTNDQIKAILRSSTHPINLSGVNPSWYFGTGRIDAKVALDLAPNPPYGHLDTSNLGGTLSGTVPIHGSVGAGTYTLEWGTGLYPSTYTTIATGTGPITNGVLASFSSVDLADGKYTIRLRVTTAGHEIQDQTFVTVDNLIITSPTPKYDNLDFYRTGTVVPVMGTVAGSGFQHYTMDWCAYPDVQHGCTLGPFTDGITLTDGGTHPVYGARIGQFNSSVIANHVDGSRPWKIRIMVHVTGTATQEEGTDIQLDPQLRFMRRISDDPDSGQYILPPNEPTIADLDGDGKKEICSLMKNVLTCLTSTGALKAGFPVTLPAFGSAFYNFYQTLPLTAIDVGDGDPNPELLFSAYEGETQNTPRLYVYAINGDGSTVPGYPRRFQEPGGGTNGQGFPTESSPVIAAQLIPGGEPEFILHNFDVLIPFDAQGNILSGTPINLRAFDTGRFVQNDQPIGWTTSVAVGQFDSDPSQEIVVVHQYGYGSLPGGYGRIWVLNPDGSVLSGWPRTIETSTRSSPVVADLDYDGLDEVIVGVYPGYNPSGSATQGLYAFNARGELLPGFPWHDHAGSAPIPTQVQETPAIADLDGDGRLEMVVASTDTTGGSTWALHAITTDGTEFPGWNPPAQTGSLNPRILDTSLAPGTEIYDAGNATSYGNVITGYDTHANVLAPTFPKATHYQTLGAPILTDLDGDGHLEMVVGANHPFSGVQYTANPDSGTLFVYDLTTPAGGPVTLNREDWPMFQHDLARTGHYTRATTPPAPGPATGIAASVDQDPQRITVTFTNAALAPDVKVYRSTTPTTPCAAGAIIEALPFVPPSTPISVVQTTQENGIQAGVDYYYSIATRNASGETCAPITVHGRAGTPSGGTGNGTPAGSQQSAGGTQIVPTLPAPPTNVTANDGTNGDKIRVTGTGSTGAQNYDIYRNTTNNSGTATKINPAPLTSLLYNDTTIAPGQVYWYWATAHNAAGTSGFSNGDSGYALGIPANVNASDGTSADHITLAWSAVPGATDYAIYRATTPTSACGGVPYITATGTTYTDNGLASGSTYYYSLKAHAPAGYGLCSAVDAGSTSPGGGSSSGCASGDTDNGNGTCTRTLSASTGTGTGYLGQNAWSNWAATIGAGYGNALTAPALEQRVESTADPINHTYAHTRAFERFTIPPLAGMTLLEAKLTITPTQPAQVGYNADGYASAYLVPAAPFNPLQYSDYSALTLASAQAYGRVPLASITTTNPVTFTLNASGRAAIQAAAGNTFAFALIEGHGLDNRSFNPLSAATNLLQYAGSATPAGPTLSLVYSPTS